MPVLTTLGQPTEPAVQQAGDLGVVQQVVQPRQLDELVLVTAAWPAPPSTHNRSPQTVLTARPWAVWVWRLASYSTFWLAHPRGRCTRVASPSTKTALPDAAISASHWRRSSTVATNVPSGWQNPRSASGPSSRSRLSPTSSWRS